MQNLYSVLLTAIILIGYVPTVFAESPQAIIFAAGDIAQCKKKDGVYEPGQGAVKTATLLTRLLKKNPSANVLVLGDLVYNNGTEEQFELCYEPTWGQFKNRSFPVPGNHEYYENRQEKKEYDIQPYQKYWKDRFMSSAINSGIPQEGYYRVDIGNWRIIGLNSTVVIEDSQSLEVYPLNKLLGNNDSDHVRKEKIANLKTRISGAALRLLETADKQEEWLKTEAFKGAKECSLVFMHHPRLSSGLHGNKLEETEPLIPIYKILYHEQVSLVVSGHDHHYERFYPMDSDGHRNYKNGMRNFVVGTGGTWMRPIDNIQVNSEIRRNDRWGVLKLELFKNYYTWQFIPTEGEPMEKSEKESCIPRTL